MLSQPSAVRSLGMQIAYPATDRSGYAGDERTYHHRQRGKDSSQLRGMTSGVGPPLYAVDRIVDATLRIGV